MHGSRVYYAWPFSDSDAATPRQTHEINAVRRSQMAGRRGPAVRQAKKFDERRTAYDEQFVKECQ